MLFDIMPVHYRDIGDWTICYVMPCGAAKTARLKEARVFATLHPPCGNGSHTQYDA